MNAAIELESELIADFDPSLDPVIGALCAMTEPFE
jgi:hypothetical protein